MTMLDSILSRARSGGRLSPDEALELFRSDDIHAIGAAADEVRRRRNGRNAYYVKNLHLNYTNICLHDCKFCGFARRPGEEGGWQMDLAQILEYADRIGLHRLTEVHIVGGLNPKYPFDFYTSMIRALKERFPSLHVKAFTATEIDFISRIGKRSWEQALRELREAGLDSMPGGGAEVFSRRVWDEVCDNKTRPDKWLGIHRTAHRLGLRSTCTMLYGHIETIEERVEHMRLLRELQDETGGFTAFIPIAFQPEKNALAHLGRTTGLDDLRTHAIARLFLDNFDHLKSYWVTLGPKMAQVLLNFGCDDIDGTIVEERIMHMSGSPSPAGLAEEELVRCIREVGCVPVQRDSLYRPIKSWN
jgi:aminodeoxyfutalosine synthase